MTKKYVFDKNGMPIIQPSTLNNDVNTPPPSYAESLAVVHTMEDMQNVSQLTNQPAPPQFIQTIQTIQSDAYLQQLNAGSSEGNSVLDGMMQLFQQYEIPIGLMTKLLTLQGKRLHFKLDDSGSMCGNSNVFTQNASSYMQSKVNMNKPMLSRWEEMQDRLHMLVDLLAYVPTGTIKFSFFDHEGMNGNSIELHRQTYSPEIFKTRAHKAIDDLFNRRLPHATTPILANMQQMLREANAIKSQTSEQTLHFMLTDGEPNGGENEIRNIELLLRSDERGGESNPFTFLGCSNVLSDYEWMHEMEETNTAVAAISDYVDEKNEIKKFQGNVFPYSRGFWLLCNLAASTNRDDLDAMDQSAPFTCKTLSELLGRGLIEPEYRWYFNQHFMASKYFSVDYQLFLTTDIARNIPSVQIYLNTIRTELDRALRAGDDYSEPTAINMALQAVMQSRPGVLGNFGVFGNRVTYGTPNNVAQQNQPSPSCCLMM